MAKVTASITIDAEVKAKAQELFSDLGLDFSTAINIFLRQAIRENRIPFDIQRPTSEDETDEMKEDQSADTKTNGRHRRGKAEQLKTEENPESKESVKTSNDIKADKKQKNESGAKPEDTKEDKPENKQGNRLKESELKIKESGKAESKSDNRAEGKTAVQKSFKTFTDMDEMVRSLIY